jgi:MFS family permease
MAGGGYLAVLRDGRYALFLVAILIHSAVYVQYLSTLPLTVHATGLQVFWYTLAVSLNGFIVIAFELLTTKVTQRWPRRVPIALMFVLLGVGIAIYGLPMAPAVIIAGTVVWSLGEIIGGPTAFAYPAIAGPEHLRGRYIGSFQFVFGAGTALGPLVGGWLFIQIGQAVWPVLAIGPLIATICALIAVRSPRASPVATRSGNANGQ